MIYLVYDRIKEFVTVIRLRNKGLGTDLIAKYLKYTDQELRSRYEENLKANIDKNLIEAEMKEWEDVDYIALNNPKKLMGGGPEKITIFPMRGLSK